MNYDYLEETTNSIPLAQTAPTKQLEMSTPKTTNESSITILIDKFKSTNGPLLSNVITCLNLAFTVLLSMVAVLIKRYLSKKLRTIRQLLNDDLNKNTATNNDLINI